MPSERQYPLATISWEAHRPSHMVVITTDDQRKIAQFPISFIANGGINTWGYVVEVVSMLVDHDPQFQSTIHDVSGTVMNPENAPVAGTFTYAQPGRSSAFHFSRGPEYFTSVLPANVEGSSTRSHSSRSTINQSHFRTAVIARDGHCLITKAYYSRCEAAHIVPQSRPDIYRQLLGMSEDQQPYMFSASYGLLLRKDLHHAFDRMEFSFFPSGDSYYLHSFDQTCIDQHGKRLSPQHFRSPPNMRPDPAFLAWHYAQCVKARIRGFSAGMAN